MQELTQRSWPVAEALFVGRPRVITDAQGSWRSSIFREQVYEAVSLSFDGLAGDEVTQPYHGGRGAAICIHLTDHYQYWNTLHSLNLQAGCMGENLTLRDVTEGEICAGDIVHLGTALVQVSGPRVPCANLARRIGRSDWVKLTIRANRTGFYARVLECGVIQAGDEWRLQDRVNKNGSIPAINACMYLNFDPGYAHDVIQMQGLDEWWKIQMRERLEQHDEHWTSKMNL
jgi:MOSC domain-containing protein YiiM